MQPVVIISKLPDMNPDREHRTEKKEKKEKSFETILNNICETQQTKEVIVTSNNYNKQGREVTQYFIPKKCNFKC